MPLTRVSLTRVRLGAVHSSRLCVPNLADVRSAGILSRGAYARVWLARKRATRDVYALKAVRTEGASAGDGRTQIGVEQRILLGHSSDFLVRCFFSFSSAQHVFFALEFCAAGDLASMLKACGCLEEPAVRSGHWLGGG